MNTEGLIQVTEELCRGGRLGLYDYTGDTLRQTVRVTRLPVYRLIDQQSVDRGFIYRWFHAAQIGCATGRRRNGGECQTKAQGHTRLPIQHAATVSSMQFLLVAVVTEHCTMSEETRAPCLSVMFLVK